MLYFLTLAKLLVQCLQILLLDLLVWMYLDLEKSVMLLLGVYLVGTNGTMP